MARSFLINIFAWKWITGTRGSSPGCPNTVRIYMLEFIKTVYDLYDSKWWSTTLIHHQSREDSTKSVRSPCTGFDDLEEVSFNLPAVIWMRELHWIMARNHVLNKDIAGTVCADNTWWYSSTVDKNCLGFQWLAVVSGGAVRRSQWFVENLY